MSHILHPNNKYLEELGSPIVAEIFRYDPSTDQDPYVDEYRVPYYKRMSVFTLLREIYEKKDPTLAFRNQQCGRGICGVCHLRVEINGKENELVKACSVPLKPGDCISIYPRNQEKIIRDLVTY